MRVLFTLCTAVLFLLVTNHVFSQNVVYYTLYTDNFDTRTINETKPVGAIEGEAAVSATGSATYTIPVKVPAGINGVVPAVNLIYNSQGGDGIIGPGWSLSGLSAIVRAGNDMYNDGSVTTVAFTNDDNYVLDGQRLYAVTGTNGADGTIYATETESFAQITSYGSVNGGEPDYFEVITKDGTTLEYSYAYSRDYTTTADPYTKTISWHLYRITDINGNTITYSYSLYGRQLLLNNIAYSANASADVGPVSYVEFTYQLRTDKNMVYAAGASIDNKYLLTQIKTKTDYTTYGISYTLSYGYDGGQSYLSEITETGTDGTTTLNSTIFKYGSEPSDYTVSADLSAYSGYDSYFPGDFDGDGISDLLITEDYFDAQYIKHQSKYSITSSSIIQDQLLYSYVNKGLPSGSTVDGVYNDKSKITTFGANNIFPSDYDADGRDDVVYFNTSNAAGSSGDINTTFNNLTIQFTRNTDENVWYTDSIVQKAPSVYGTSYKYSEKIKNMFIPGDFDGDGRQDYILLLSQCFCDGYKAFFNSPATSEYSLEISNFGVGTNTGSYFASTVSDADRIIPIDYDGDGDQELFICASNGFNWVIDIKRVSVATGYSVAATNAWVWLGYLEADYIYPGDFNGDKITDLLAESLGTSNWKIYYGTGRGYTSTTFTWNHTLTSPGGSNMYDDHILIADFNGDGKSDILDAYYTSSYITKFNMYYSRGYDATAASAAFTNEVYTSSNMLMGYISTGDFNGDGRSDIINYNALSTFRYYYFKPAGHERLIEKIKDGFNATTVFTYKNLTDKAPSNVYSKTIDYEDTENTYPYNCIQQPAYVVSNISTPDGIDGTFDVSYTYEDALLHRAGHGFLGFKKITATNADNNTVSVNQNTLNTQYALLYPAYSSVARMDNDFIISDITPSTSFTSTGTTYQKRFKIQTDNILAKDYLNKRCTYTVNVFDAYNNITTATVYTGGVNDAATNPVETTVTTATYGIHNTPVPAKPESVTVTKKRNSSTSLSQTTAITYTTNGLPYTQTDFYGLAKAVTTTYTYDAFGNMLTAILSSSGETNRGTKYTYDATGRYQLTKELITGATGSTQQKETYTYNTATGTVATITDNDNIKTSYLYDAFNFTTTVVTSSGTTNKTPIFSFRSWDATTTVNGHATLYRITSYSSNIPVINTWYDKIGRVVKEQTTGYNKINNISYTYYDAGGRVYYTSGNTYNGESGIAGTYTFDKYNRTTAVTNIFGTTQFAYSAASTGKATVTTTLPDGRITKKTTDAAGRVVRVVDDGGILVYYYDSRGNLLKTKHDDVFVITNTYDSYGRQATLTDKDAGTISYTYDAWGNLTNQADANSNSFTMQYDALNRITAKKEPSATIAYTYYTNTTTGLSTNSLSTVTRDGLTRSYTYDGFMRVSAETVTNSDGTAFTTSYTYNKDNDQVVNTVYPSGLTVTNVYDEYGYLTSVTANDGSSTKTIFTGSKVNAFGQYTSYTLGNGKSSTNTFYYGMPTRLYTAGIQDLNLSFDYTDGNLLSRYDAIKGKTETFTYDALNRLSTIKLGGTLTNTITYDNSSGTSYGNITTKTDAGNYTYFSDKIHAVQYIQNATDNKQPPAEISTNTQSITYTPFLKTNTITENGYTLTYSYDENYQRAKSVLQQGSTVAETKYYAGDYEKQITSTATREIHYVAGGNGLCAIIVKQGGTYSYYYTYTDHLGSILTVTDATGAVTAEQNFDAWGRSRNASTWLYTSVASVPGWLYRGYTGHEHLTQFSLINMNGRMYDPVAGRMLSADNYVQEPYNTQSYNRYAYCVNNPLKYTDPDGDFWLLVAAALLFTDVGYDIQKAVSPIALHVDLSFGSHSNGIGLDVSVGLPQLLPISYRFDAGATYYFSRVGGYGSGWQTRIGGEWGIGFGLLQYGGTRYRDYNKHGDLEADQVVHTMQVGTPLINASYSNDTENSFPWAKYFPLIPKLQKGQIAGLNSDRYRTASGRLRAGLFELGFFLHTGEGTEISTVDGVRYFDGGNINDPKRSNGIMYLGFGSFKIGWDSEKIRHLLQNRMAHDSFSSQPQYGLYYPWVLTLDRRPRFVFQFGNF